ncbi:hypothetical protein RHSIM_Rhsim13G0171400 [Rhododendron simsii]|uniref:AAA+ ATPase domain-containing protein n=1 Tax=Rhododendron simsii TaxID=118357 RepID=A0A834L7S4_RHOSS|nr:hypothetical protein RHSIM_Rhsim13G0171400 [Rhododendron simsii]
MATQVETIRPELNEEKRCVGGLCLDIFPRIELVPIVVDQPDPPSTLAKSANRTLNMVLDKMQHKSTLKIGIWGMGGVGKTTVLRLLNNTPEITRIFDFVIWVTVSKSQSIRMIQEEVGQRLLVEIMKDWPNDRVASKLRQKLHDKKYLLLLDDVWEMVDLDLVGLLNPNQNNGCKVVLTTRKFEVCRQMGTDVEIKVKVLPEEEAREMFYANVGDVVRLPAIKRLAESIVTECDGLPLALKVVSGALRKEEDVNVWENFLRELRSPATSFIKDLNEKVFNILKVSYDHLEDTQKKQCLLFCGLYPEDSEIEKSELIGYWRAEGILSRELTLHEAHVKGHAILRALIDSSLLEEGNDDDRVKMHDVVRDLVLAMTSPKGGEPQHLVRAGISSGKIPDAVEWEKATRISFIDHDLCNLPESPDCPELLTLLLQGNERLRVIPETFFNNMPKLKVLDLSRTGIESLPTSISKLESLRGLVLSECESLEALPAGVISKLSQIEVFKLEGSDWASRLSDESTEIVAKELSELSSLSSLGFEFQDVGGEERDSGLPSAIQDVFSSGFMVQQLSNLEELVVNHCGGLKGMIPEDEVVEHEALPKLRMLGLQDLPEFVNFFKGVPMRWQSLEWVGIINCPKLRKLPFDTNSAPNLKEIEGGRNSQEWWDALEWDNDATRLQFQPIFRKNPYC